MEHPSNSPTPERLMQLAWGYAPPLIIQAAVDHKLFDQLDHGPRTAQELAKAAGASERGIAMILNALVGLQLLSRTGDRYALTPESSLYLVSSKPSYRGGFFRHMSHQLIPNWIELSHIVQTGRPASRLNQNGDGAHFFAEFVESLFPLSYAAAQKLGEHLGVPKTNKPVSVLDIGSGSGVWGIALAQQSPQVRVRAVDWPEVLKVTERVSKRHGVHDRFSTAPGDLLQADFGQGHQVATIGHILHSEGPDRSKQLLKKTFNALAPGGTVAVSEFVVDDDRTGPPMALIFAVNMLVHTENGNTFTFPEMSSWMREAGFVNPRLLDVPSVSPLVLATRP